MPEPTALEARWDEVRTRFQFSPMADTRLTTLAENASAKPWPLRGVDETPSKYFDASFGELKSEFNLEDNAITLLIEILEETLAFDDSYVAMINPEIEDGLAEHQVTTALRNLGVPTDYPVELTGLSDDTVELCKLEEVRTVGDFAEFSQRMADNVVVGGDFRAILNALAHGDEDRIAEVLPIRPGKQGLHFPEALGILIRNRLSQEEQEAFAVATGFAARGSMTPAKARAGAARAKDKLDPLINRLILTLNREVHDLAESVRSGQRTLERCFIVLDDPRTEHLAILLAGPLIKGKTKVEAPAPTGSRVLSPTASSDAPAESAPKRRGFFARLFRRG